MLRVIIRAAGSTQPNKILMFDPAVTNTLTHLVELLGYKLGVNYRGSGSKGVKVYLVQPGDSVSDCVSDCVSGSSRVVVEDVSEIRDGDVLLVEKSTSDDTDAGTGDGTGTSVGTGDTRCSEGVKGVTDEKEKEQEEESDDEVQEVHVPRPPPVIIDMCDSDSDSDRDNKGGNIVEKSNGKKKKDTKRRYSWLDQEDEELLSSDEEQERYYNMIKLSYVGEDDNEKEEIRQHCKEKSKVFAKSKQTKTKPGDRQEIYGHIDEDDLPMAPGTLDQNNDVPTSHSESSSAPNPPVDPAITKVKARIAKMLQLGLHHSTSEAESQHAMKVAQKLLQKFNLTQAAVMLSQETGGSDLNDSEALQGGMVTVQIRRCPVPLRKSWGVEPHSGIPYAPAVSHSWIVWLSSTVADNFQVKCYYDGPSAKFTFYGLKTNTQLAAYAFKIAVEKVAIMKNKYAPPEGEYERKRRQGLTSCGSKGGYTLVCRHSYCEGIVSGIRQFVNKCKREEEDARAEKLAKARGKRSRQAREEDDNVYNSDADDDDEYSDSPTKSNVPDSKRIRQSGDDKSEETSDELRKLEDEARVSTALIIHSEDIADKILKARGIKFKSSTRMGRVETNHAAWSKGVDDSKNINLNERAIKSD